MTTKHRYRPEYKDRPVFTCSICGDTVAGQWGNNAEPVNEGCCCDECNFRVVIPMRLYDLRRQQRQHHWED
jgi:DNA-directed RNA polymerase subunit RPC12/RpoP